jgi:hypothetical protein
MEMLLPDLNDVYRAEIRGFLCTTIEIIRHYAFCPIVIEPVIIDNF